MTLEKGLFLALVVAAATLSLGAAGQSAPEAERWDEDVIVTLDGTESEVERPGATLESEGKEYTVHLGPVWYWKQNGYRLSAGDQVTVTGQLEKEGSGLHLYLYSLRRGDETYRFVDDDGVPLWSRGRGWGCGRRAGRGRGWAGGHHRCAHWSDCCPEECRCRCATP